MKPLLLVWPPDAIHRLQTFLIAAWMLLAQFTLNNSEYYDLYDPNIILQSKRK